MIAPWRERPRRVVLTAAALAWSLALAAPAAGCTGDCDANGEVAVDEALRGVGIALGRTALATCPPFDRDGSGAVTVDELLDAVRSALRGCAATATASPSVTLPAATATPTPTPSPHDGANRPPVLPTSFIYRTYEGLPIALPLAAVDPDDGPVICRVDGLPPGAAFDGEVLRWTPAVAQLGAFALPFTCSDTGTPALSGSGTLRIKVLPRDACSRPVCDAATGCTSALPPLDEGCCDEPPVARVAEPAADCPEGTVVFLGRNAVGFGRLQHCDQLRVRNFAQRGAEVSFHVEARCLQTSGAVTAAVRIETAERLLVDASAPVFLSPFSGEFARARNIGRFEVGGPAPFFDIEGAEANVTVTLTDAGGAAATEQLRLRLTFANPAALPEVDPAEP